MITEFIVSYDDDGNEIVKALIRCKDCKYWNECGFGMRDDQCHCSRIDYWTNADWFCADGEERDA